MRRCMWLGYTPQIIFFFFYYNLNLVIFWTFLYLESDLPVGGITFINTLSSSTKNKSVLAIEFDIQLIN